MAEQTMGSGSQAARPRTYTDEYRRQVVDMVTSTGRTAMSVAAELGIHHTLISRWIRRYGPAGQASAPASQAAPASPLRPVPVPHADQAAEIARLRREVERLRMERDILKNVWPAPSARVKLDGVLVCINVSGLRGRALAKMGSARSRPHKVRGVGHHIFGQAAETPVRPLSHLSFTSADLVRGSGVGRPLSHDQAVMAWCS